MNQDAIRQLTIDLKEIFRRLEDLEMNPYSITGGVVPAPVAQGDTLLADAVPAWAILSTPGAAGYARISTAATEEWDQTPQWTGLHNFAAGLTIEDDQPLNFGIGLDGVGQYVSASNYVRWTGVDWYFNNLIVNIGTAVGGGGEPLAVRIDQNANTGIELVNANAGAAATALARFKNTAGAGGNHALDIGVLGTGFTTSGPAYQDGGMIQTGANISALTIRTIADVSMYLATAATVENMRLSSSGIVVNNGEADLDFRVAWDTGDALFVQGSDGKVLLNTATEDANILATTLVQVIDSRLAVSQDGTSNSIDVYAYGAASVPKITFKTAGGTRAAPSAALSGTYLGAFDFTGYGAAFYDSGGAQIFGQASEDWAAGNRGANLGFSTTPSGSAGGSIRAMIQNSGEFDIIEYLRHYGDTDTYRRFQTNQITDVAGGTSFIDMASATGLITLAGTGLVVPDNYYIGLGAAAGRIEFDDQATDEVNILDARLGVGTNTPQTNTHFYVATGAYTIRMATGDDSNLSYQGYSNGTHKTNWGYSATDNALKFSHAEAGTTLADDHLVIKEGLVGVGAPSPAAKLHVDQTSTTAAIPVLYLDQADVSEEMIEFNSTIGVGNAIEAVGAKTLTTTHFIKVTLPGGLTRYIPVGTIA